ncbi:MAG: hypothetical protein O7B26_00720 [Planctomycetota bacterium]|nr:hypothetical protein [Planctomycetota bacterium]
MIVPDRIDEFESLFKSSDKPLMVYDRVAIRSVMVVTDLGRAESDQVTASARRFLSSIEEDGPTWETVLGDGYRTVDDLLGLVSTKRPDLIVAHRNLHDADRHPKLSLGTYLDELTQHTQVPVLVLPNDDAGRPLEPPAVSRSVMVVTDHLTGDGKLIAYGARLTAPDGTLVLAHIENDATFSRYMQAIEKIPEIVTETARALLREQLLKEPREYIKSCSVVLKEAGHSIRIEPVVEFGHGVKDYLRLHAEHTVDLIVYRVRDDMQIAMSGMAYLMAMEFTRTPLLLL